MKSVRTRLTVVLVVMAAVIASLAVILGARLVERQLVDRKLDDSLRSSIDAQTGELIFPVTPVDFSDPLFNFQIPAGLPLDVADFPPTLFSALVSVEEYNAITGQKVTARIFDGPVPRSLLYLDIPDFFTDPRMFPQMDQAAGIVSNLSADVQSLADSGALPEILDDIATEVGDYPDQLDQVDVVLSPSSTAVLSRSGSITLVDRPPAAIAVTLDLLVELTFVLQGGLLTGGSPFDFLGPNEDAVFAYREVTDLAPTDPADPQLSLRLVTGADITGVAGDVNAVLRILWFAAAALVLLAGAATWILTGRALRPVAAIREQVLAINSGTLSERVPVANQHDEIGRLATTMNGMLDRLESGLVKRRQFVSDAAHELRTPVAVLQSEAEVALRAPDRTSTDELATSVLEESRRLGAVVEDLLTLARVDEEQDRLPGALVDLDDLVLEQARRQRRLPVDRTGVSAGRVMGRSDDLERMVGHLLDNAARHGRARVWVAMTADNGVVRLTIDDDGDGIPAADRDRVFERFVRLDDARSRDAGGSGLGLSVVAATVYEHGGSVSADESPHGGARIVVRLPLAGGVVAEPTLVPA